MKEEEKKGYRFYKDLIQEAGLEKPSKDFTTLVMHRIGVEASPSETLTYKPLIPKYAWWSIAVAWGVLCYYMVAGSGHRRIWDTPQVDGPFLRLDPILEIFNNFQIPDTFTYATVCFALFVIVQTVFLRSLLDRRISL
ncbi:MAG: hypothetical protein AAGA86_05210 [Bacteroidota bacterium]